MNKVVDDERISIEACILSLIFLLVGGSLSSSSPFEESDTSLVPMLPVRLVEGVHLLWPPEAMKWWRERKADQEERRVMKLQRARQRSRPLSI